MNDKEQTKGQDTLRDKVQKARDQAREILRMQMINSLLQDLFHDNKCLNDATKDLAYVKKQLAIAEYELSKLDKEHPAYEDKKKNYEDKIIQDKKDIENVEKRVESCQKVVDATNAEIAKAESGEKLVSIEDVKKLTDELLGC